MYMYARASLWCVLCTFIPSLVYVHTLLRSKSWWWGASGVEFFFLLHLHFFFLLFFLLLVFLSFSPIIPFIFNGVLGSVGVGWGGGVKSPSSPGRFVLTLLRVDPGLGHKKNFCSPSSSLFLPHFLPLSLHPYLKILYLPRPCHQHDDSVVIVLMDYTWCI